MCPWQSSTVLMLFVVSLALLLAWGGNPTKPVGEQPQVIIKVDEERIDLRILEEVFLVA